MHKAYRDLTARVESAVEDIAEAKRFVAAIGDIDDLDPLRVPALKAMKRVPAPPLRLVFEVQGPTLFLAAENLTRKRKAQKLTSCAMVDYPDWLFDPHGPSGAALPEPVKLDILQMLKESFALLGTRIGVYFPVTFGQELVIQDKPAAHLTIRGKSLSEMEPPTVPSK
jgi:hypothetical protein